MRRVLAALSTAVLAAVMLVATAQPASASDCSHPHPFLDGTGGFVTGSNVNMRTGPHYPPGLSCTILNVLQYGWAAQYYCYTVGDSYSGWSTWTWVYVPAVGRAGWVNDALLQGNGSWSYCGG
ncbi:MAG TPA: hypothetical protein VFM54_19185 [Micromonosporaceae bacterium]|nr:hypothetical protein [Micromonosporaceae bacterium]